MPLLAIVGLALLAAPRVVLHDLGIITEGTVVNSVLVFVPLAVWIVVPLLLTVPRPFLTVLTIGILHGVMLAAIHQILLESSLGGLPELDGNLADLAPAAQAAIIRVFSGLSSLVTGTAIGAICGLITWGLSALRARRT